LEDDSDLEQCVQFATHLADHNNVVKDHDIAQSNINLNELRQDALARQRPVGYNPERPLYNKHGPAKEELELMSVVIIEDPD
jgi:hypothetical protein